MWLVTYEAREPMSRCNRQLPSHIDPAIVVIKRRPIKDTTSHKALGEVYSRS